ncbi:MAG: MATE family efflux transporter [Deltaproteobacteria bacterium]|nr:MATE family efflux transporter [Deltaproteobacteria bacterium]
MTSAPTTAARPARGAFHEELRQTGRLAFPLATAHASIMLMGVVDVAVVGNYDPVHLSGTWLANALTHGTLVFGSGIVLALEPLMAQALGAGEHGRAWSWWRTGLKVAFATAIPLALLALALVLLSTHLGVKDDIHAQAVNHMLARTPGNFVFVAYLAARAFLQSHQSPRALLVAALAANVVNLLVDLALVDGLVTWGATGAGIATSLSTLFLFGTLARAARALRPPPDTPLPPTSGRQLVKVGLPLGVQLAAEFLVFTTCGVLATTLGEVAGSAHAIALQWSTLSFMASVGLSSAAAARIGAAIGQGRQDLVRLRARAATTWMLIVMGTSAILFATCDDLIAELNAPDTPAVSALAAQLLRIAALFQLVDGLQVVMSGCLRGVGDLRFPFVLTVLGYWAVGFPVAWGLAFPGGMGAEGLWYGLTAGLAAASVALAWRFLHVSARAVGRLER